MMHLRNAKVAKNDEKITVFFFSKFLVSGRGNASKDGVTRGVTSWITRIFAVSYTTYHIRPWAFGNNCWLRTRRTLERSEKEDNKANSSLFTMKMPVFTVGRKSLMIFSLYLLVLLLIDAFSRSRTLMKFSWITSLLLNMMTDFKP